MYKDVLKITKFIENKKVKKNKNKKLKWKFFLAGLTDIIFCTSYFK